MAAFIASYSGPTGQPRTVTIKAANLAEAKKLLRRRGIRAEELRPVSPGNSQDTKTDGAEAGGLKSIDLNRMFEKAPGVKEKAVFASKLAALVDAGVPIVRSLDLMATQQKLPMFKRALTKVSLDVNEGIALATALRQWPKVFDQLSIAMVEAGEAGGVLDEALKRLAKLLEDNAKLQNQIKGALGYPIAVLVIAILVFLGMTIFLIPTFAGIFEDLGAELPAFTRLLVDLSALLRSSASLYAIGVILLAIWMLNRFYATHNGRRTIDRLMLKLPLFGELILMTATAQFCRIFSSLTRAGVPILMSMEISSETAGNAIISDAILASRAMVQEGVLLSNALIRQKVLPDMALNMLAIGEETGEMDKMLSKVADFYEDEVGAMVKALTSMLEPAMIVVVGGIVGSILLAMYLPMFTVFDQIQ
ncbi:type II secretion system F family protein [Synechococcus sp. YX-04-1]|uniref:type II secretion system F family protein n=1 Tax=unclassified Synechococcus TaxID=2626047 RepID=UPI001CF91E20|nr:MULTISPECIES: type II secretion system F family protein [unclassified Synechococcus]MCB4389312.1 type II secretion system F family protein [Synechococcus sp. MU1617]MDO6351241.1 type II secretion system F family protein [Synechococcus sp. YX-04-1]